MGNASARNARLPLAIAISLVASAGCGTSTAPSPAPAPAPVPVPEQPSPPRAAPLAVLGLDGRIRILDAHDLTAPPAATLEAPDAEVIFDARDDGAILLGDHFHDEHRRVLLVRAGADVRELEGDGSFAAFAPGGDVVARGLGTDPECSSAPAEPLLYVLSPRADRARAAFGSYLGPSSDGRSWIMERAPACTPGGARAEGPPRIVRFDRATGESRPLPASPLTLAITRGTDVVATLEVTGIGTTEHACSLHVAHAVHPLPSGACRSDAIRVSPDGRYLAWSTPARDSADLVVVSARSGAPVAAHQGHPPLGTIRLHPPIVSCCFSHDGERLVLVHPDGELALTTPDASRPPRSLGYGDCRGFSADDRFVLAVTSAPRTTQRVIDVATVAARTLEPAWDALFLPATARDQR